MYKLNSKKVLSVIVSVILLMSSVLIPGSVAIAEYAGPSATDGGAFEHTRDYEYNDGRGLYYISFGVNGINFYRMQTEDNETMTITPELWVVKNDSVNVVKNFKVAMSEYTDENWSYDSLDIVQTLGPDVTITSDNGVEDLPDHIGSRYDEMLANYLVKWNYTYTFTADGSAVYSPRLNVSYRSGKTNLSMYDHSTDADNEPVIFTVTVSDARRLLGIMDAAQAYAQDNQEIASVLSLIENNYDLSGSAYYSQALLDGLCTQLGSLFPADYTAYLAALEDAYDILGSNVYTAEEKAAVTAAIANKDDILSQTKDNQAVVDAATDTLNDLIRSFNPEPVENPNSVSADPDNTNVSMFYCTEQGSTSTVSISTNYSIVYMDISENLSDTGLTWTYAGSFNNVHFVPGPLNALCLGPDCELGVGSSVQPVNFDQYFSNYGTGEYAAAAEMNLLPDTANATGPQTATVQLDGVPLRTTTGDYETIYLGYYWLHTKTGIGGYSRNSTNNFALSDGYDIPSFKIVIYDKSQLKATINDALAQIRRDAANYSDFADTVSDAIDVYNTREVTQADINNAIAQISNFQYSYTFSISSSDPSIGTVSYELVSGSLNQDGSYTEGSQIRISAAPIDIDNNTPGVQTDYRFDSWSDGSTDNPRIITISDRTDLTAQFEFIPADYSELQDLIDLYDSYDKSILDDDYKDTVESMFENVPENLGQTGQDTLDAYLDTLSDLLNDPEYALCDYSYLDELLDRTENLPATNDGTYPADVWDDYVAAVAAAENVDRDLRVVPAGNQDTIDDIADDLAAAIQAVTDISSSVITFTATPSDTTIGTVSVALVSGQQTGTNTYSLNAIVSVQTTVINPDYVFSQWSDGSTDNPRIMSVLDGSVTAEYEFIPIDMDELEDLIDTYNAMDKTVLDPDYVSDMDTYINNLEDYLDNSNAGQWGQSHQSEIDGYADYLAPYINNPVYKDCDYTALKTALNKANNVPDTNDGRYPSNVWTAYQTALAIAESVPDDLTLENSGNQTIINAAAADLENAITTLGAARYPLIKVYNQNNVKVKEIPAAPVNDNPAIFGSLKDELPEIATDEDRTVAGWLLDNGDAISDYYVISADTNIYPYIEYSRIVPEGTSSVVVSRGNTFVIKGLSLGANTVAEIKDELLNEYETLVFTRNGVTLADTDLVGTGCTVKLLSARDSSLVYEEATVILYGDVTGDGIVNENDIEQSFGWVMGENVAEEIFYLAADTNHDTVVDGFDISLIDLASTGTNKISQIG